MSFQEGENLFQYFPEVDFSTLIDGSKFQAAVKRMSNAGLSSSFGIPQISDEQHLYSLLLSGGIEEPSQSVSESKRVELAEFSKFFNPSSSAPEADPSSSSPPSPIVKIEGDKVPASKRKRKAVTPTLPEPETSPNGVDAQQGPGDERSIKRQRRLVKNREAAQLFRQRQKAYIQDLERKVTDLASTNQEVRARVEVVVSENKMIKEQLLYLRNFISQALAYSHPSKPSGEPSNSAALGSTLVSLTTNGLPSGLPLNLGVPNMSFPAAMGHLPPATSSLLQLRSTTPSITTPLNTPFQDLKALPPPALDLTKQTSAL